MKILKITPPKSNPGLAQTGMGTKVETESGDEVQGISSITVQIGVENYITAEITVVPHMEEVWALPFMSEASFLQAAERYGYNVAKRRGDK